MSEALLTDSPAAGKPEREPVSGVTLLALALVPSALVLLLVLHCLLLGYKLLRLAGRRRAARCHSATTLPRWQTSPAARFSPAPNLASSRAGSWRTGSAPVLLMHSSGTDGERVHAAAPPNSPEQLSAFKRRASLTARMMRRSSTMELELISLDKVHVEGEIISSIPPEASCFIASINSSAAGPGLDSDFGASAGVSLRILSADSDGFPGAPWASGLEWDYYDPSYVTQNHVPKQRHHAPSITIKQYWV